MKLFQKNHGAVTVFLVIILVPVILVTSIFVDVCRVELAQSVVGSAGDLALNTLLSQYDTDLNEFYGMMASSQSMEEFYETAGEFYETALQSRGLKDESGAVAEKIKEILQGDQETADLLQISWEGDQACEFETVTDGNLANPALVKKEIVEFMKYRSPINGAADLLKKLKDSSKALEDSEKDAELVERKEDYYEAEKDVMDAALNAYKELKKYQDMAIDKRYVDDLIKYTNNLESDYKKIDEKVIKDLFNTNGLGVFEVKAINFSPVVPAAQAFSESKKATAQQVGNYLNAYAKAENNFREARERLENALNLLPEYNSKVYDIQYWRYCAQILSQSSGYANYAAAANTLCEKYAFLKNAIEFMEDGVDSSLCIIANYTKASSTGAKSVHDHWEIINKEYSNCQKRFLHANDSYFQIGNRLHKISSNNISAINGDETSRKISEISTRLKVYKSEVEEAKGYLDAAEDKVLKLKKFREDYQTAKNNWKTSADGSNTELAAKDREEISKLSQEQEIMSNITEAKISELVSRIQNIKSLFAEIVKALESCKYNGTKILEIENLNDFKSKSGIDEGRITYKKEELKSYVGEHSRKIVKDAVNVSVNNQNNPAMGQVKTPSLYAWLMNYFKDYEKNEEKCENGKKDYDNYKKNQDGKNEDADTNGNATGSNEIKNEGERPSKTYEENLEEDKTKTHSSIQKVAEFTKELCGDFTGTLASLGVKTRDDLYSVDYIMSMFSYDTYENEGKYALCKDESITLLDYLAGKYDEVETDWKSDKVTDTYNKSLTNHMINADNNWAYQSEVEYILYGGTNLQNKAAAYSRIFLLRYALNLPAEFINYWNDDGIKGIAEGISLATYGIIPAPLVKLAIILALTILETGTDLLYLKAGIPVLLVKGTGDLFIDFSVDGIKESITDASKKGKGKTNHGGFSGLKVKFQYSDYIKLFLFLKLFDEEGSYKVYARTADVIQVNMKYKIAAKEDYELKKSIVYFKLKSDVRVQPLMLDLPLMRSEEANQVDTIKGLDWCKINYNAVRGY